MFADLLSSPGVEEHVALRSRVGFLALHGGLEQATAEIAAEAAARASASWSAVVQPAGSAWHLPSHRFDPDESPRLQDVLAHCEIVVSLHGFGRTDLWTSVLVGGAERGLAEQISVELRTRLPEYEIVDDIDAIPAELRGLDARNPVNRTSGGGVQLELPPRVRGMGPHWRDSNHIGFAPHTEALVDALASFAIAKVS